MSAARIPLLFCAFLIPGCVPVEDDTGGDSGDTGAPLTVVAVTGDITEATTWTRDNLYRLDVSIGVTAPLTIEAGTIVKLGDQLGITVDEGGALLAGGGDQPCVFTSTLDDAHGGDTNGDGATTSPAPGDWGSIVVRASGSVIDHCLIAYGGALTPYTGALAVQADASITVTDSTFAWNLGGTPDDLRAAAFDASGAGVGTVVSGDVFYGNDVPFVVGGTFDVDDSHLLHADVDGETVGNDYDGVFWGGSYELVGARSWTMTDAPFVIVAGVLGVPEDASFTLGDGVVVKLGNEQRIDGLGPMTATNVVFTSFLDDTVGGDTNGDAAATTPAPGDWGYIQIRSSATTFDGFTLSYAGAAAPYTGALTVEEEAEPHLRDGVFSHNGGGTFADSRAATLNLGGAGAGVVASGNVFTDNDLPMVVNGDVSLDGTNTFQDNVVDAIVIDADSHRVTGTTTWAEDDVAVVLYHLTLSVDEGATLVLGDGAVMKSEDGRIDVNGTVQSGEDSYFTSLLDDAHIGDTNGDAGATTPEKGDWSGVNLCQGGPCEWADWGNILYAAYP